MSGMTVVSVKETAFERLKALLAEAEVADDSWRSSGKHTEWRGNVRSAMRHLLGENSDKLRAFLGVNYSPNAYPLFGDQTPYFREAFVSGLTHAQGIIRSALTDFEIYEMPHDPPKSDNHDRAEKEVVPTNRKVFVVHGHDNEMKEAVARFLEQLDLEPIILHEQPNGGATIIEKFERNASTVSFAIVLLSPDDLGAAKTKPKQLEPRARQNVLLELGYFVGSLGRGRVCPLLRGDIEPPSDIHDIVYVPFEGEAWKVNLIKELRQAGFEIDSNKVI